MTDVTPVEVEELVSERVDEGDHDRIRAMYRALERRCITLLALEAPVAGDLRVVVTALHALCHAQRMGNLARHVAVIARFKRPNPMTSARVRPVLARMSLLTSQLAADASQAVRATGVAIPPTLRELQ